MNFPRKETRSSRFLLQKPGHSAGENELVETEFLKFNYASLVSFFSLSLSFVRLRTTYKKRKRGEKKLFRLFRQKFSTKYFSRHGGCLVSPVVRKGFSVVGFKKETSGTGRRPVQVHPTDLNSWPERSLSCFSMPT